MAEIQTQNTAPSTATDWSRVAQLRRETEQAIIRAEEATKRLDRVLNPK